MYCCIVASKQFKDATPVFFERENVSDCDARGPEFDSQL